MTMADEKSDGICESTNCNAFGPPVEIPMAIILLGGSGVRVAFLVDGGSSTTFAGGSLRPPARLATLIFSIRESAMASRLPLAACCGLGVKYHAPKDRGRTVLAVAF